MKSNLFVFFFTGVLSLGAYAGEEQLTACSSPEYSQFDFWVGRWASHNKEWVKQGTNHIHKIMGNCGIQENWAGAKGKYQGTSLNFYDEVTKKWYQTWVDNQGGHLFLSGGFDGTSMQLSGDRERKKSEAKPVRDRITWTPLDDGRVQQYWEVSEDEGKTWKVIFDGYYQRDKAD